MISVINFHNININQMLIRYFKVSWNWFHEFWKSYFFFPGCFKAALIPSKTLVVILNNLLKFPNQKVVDQIKWKICQPVFTLHPNPNTILTTVMEMAITKIRLRKNEKKKYPQNLQNSNRYVDLTWAIIFWIEKKNIFTFVTKNYDETM